MKTVTFKCEQDFIDMIDLYAARYGLNRSEAIRKAVEEVVKKEISKDTVIKAKVERISLR